MNHGCNLIVSPFNIFQARLKEFGDVDLSSTLKVYKVFTKVGWGPWLKRKLCLWPAYVINCTPLSTLSFWVSLFPGAFGYNTSCHLRERKNVWHLPLISPIWRPLDSCLLPSWSLFCMWIIHRSLLLRLPWRTCPGRTRCWGGAAVWIAGTLAVPSELDHSCLSCRTMVLLRVLF